MKKYLLPVCIAIVFIISGVGVLLYKSQPQDFDDDPPPRSTKVTDSLADTTGKQILEMKARNGYSPSTFTAKAGQPSVLRVITKNTLDCSSILLIKDLNVRKELPINGTTDIEIPPQQAGTTIKGWCTMAMYQFKIQFE